MKFRLTILFSIFYLWIHAQTKVVTNSFYFGTKLKIEKYSGNDFRYTLDVKSRQTDSLKNITILARQVINSDEWLDVNMTKDVSADTSWKKLETTGRINPKSKEIWLYVTIEGNGIFLADNIKFEIRNNEGNWIEIPIKNSNFENDGDNPLKSFLHSPKIPEGTRINALNLNDHLHGKVLEIETTKAKLTWKTFYGNNRTTGKYCLVNGIKLYYETYGKGEPLLLLHGNGQSIAAFSKQIPDFEKKYKVIAVDTRAQGKSLDNDTTKLSYDLFASDMKVLLDSLHLKKVNIVDGAMVETRP
ncbi:alpha/beta fold hydrolase [Pedobacter aquatilis]|uniref:alpha/beta fold hydrolase n=1 Tax=Pedobacter aquatilis TaxID=351343 RepID=UPI00292D374A|nr:alpha/beta fold hydrolase [Pedobacter aquatilis]